MYIQHRVRLTATSKAYVDERTQLALEVANSKLPLVGGVVTGALGMHSDPGNKAWEYNREHG